MYYFIIIPYGEAEQIFQMLALPLKDVQLYKQQQVLIGFRQILGKAMEVLIIFLCYSTLLNRMNDRCGHG
jgi:hypothetical protein